jgi:hypothetical protein
LLGGKEARVYGDQDEACLLGDQRIVVVYEGSLSRSGE